MERHDAGRAVREWLEAYRRAAPADADQMQVLERAVDELTPAQLEKFATWLKERQSLPARSDGALGEVRPRRSVRGFGLQQAPAAQPTRNKGLPGLRFIRAGR
jgi:hypothetical protein